MTFPEMLSPESLGAVFRRPRPLSPLWGGIAASAAFLAFPATAQDEGESSPPAVLNLEQFPGTIVDKVVVPVPAEIFAVLDKIDEPNWNEQLRLPKEYRPEVDRLRLALSFGATVGEGFIAVEAEQTHSVQDVGKRALRLAEALALQDAVVPHLESISEAADQEEWPVVRARLDETQQSVKNTMEDLRDEDLSTLVSLGGWLRGTQAITNLISEAYSLDKAELLNQPDLVNHFFETVGQMDEKVRQHPDVKDVHTGLGEILQALSEAEGDESTDPTAGIVSASTVKRIGEVCDRLLLRFYLDPEPEANPDDN